MNLDGSIYQTDRCDHMPKQDLNLHVMIYQDVVICQTGSQLVCDDLSNLNLDGDDLSKGLVIICQI